MKTQLSNIALEDTCSGDVVGGLLSWTVESLQALLFGKKESNIEPASLYAVIKLGAQSVLNIYI